MLTRQLLVQVIIIAVLLLSYIGFGVYMNLVQHSNIVFSHLAYVPIALAGLWWGIKSVFIALFLSIVLFIFHIIGFVTGESLLDLTRSLIFIVVAFCIGILSDKIRKNKEVLSASEQKYKALIENSPTGIYVYRDEKVVFANSGFCTLLGYTLEELIGKSVWDFIYEPDRHHVKQNMEIRKSGKSNGGYYEVRLLNKEAKVVWTDTSSSFTKFGGKPAIIVNVYDVSEKKETERKQQELSELTRIQEEQLVHSTRLAELGEMAAGIAHELNQPLTGIRNFAKNAQFMLEKDIGSQDEIQENLRLISEQVDRASKIISRMRELTRKSEKQFEPVDVNGVLKESLDFLHPQIRLAGITVFCDLTPNLPKVMGDRIRLSQVFLNLLSNAKQAMEEEKIRELSIHSFHDNKTIKVTISDTGKGFKPVDKEKLFRPFFTTKKSGQGTGLGLSISLSIIHDHHGKILASGKENRGAAFEIHIPTGSKGDLIEDG